MYTLPALVEPPQADVIEKILRHPLTLSPKGDQNSLLLTGSEEALR